MSKKIVSIVGARPNFIKAKLISDELKKQSFDEFLIHTGQHYDYNLSEIFFEGLNLKKPDVNLSVGSKAPGEQTARMIIGIEKILTKQNPKAVIIYGDTNSSLAGALAAAKHFIPIVHIEAGERSYDNESPEEINRTICDHIAKINCCASQKSYKTLKKENLGKSAYFTGDVMLDLLLLNVKKSYPPEMKIPANFILLTLHRAENTDKLNRIKKILDLLSVIDNQIIWPIHPRTKKVIKLSNIELPKNITTIPPVSYREMLWLEQNTSRIITDSGGVQKEAYWLSTPSLTLLTKTGWTETLTGNWNQLVGDKLDKINILLSKEVKGRPNTSQFGDGHAAERTIRAIMTIF